jgi:hypothetical protein
MNTGQQKQWWRQCRFANCAIWWLADGDRKAIIYSKSKLRRTAFLYYSREVDKFLRKETQRSFIHAAVNEYIWWLNLKSKSTDVYRSSCILKSTQTNLPQLYIEKKKKENVTGKFQNNFLGTITHVAAAWLGCEHGCIRAQALQPTSYNHPRMTFSMQHIHIMRCMTQEVKKIFPHQFQ